MPPIGQKLLNKITNLRQFTDFFQSANRFMKGSEYSLIGKNLHCLIVTG